MMRRAKGLRSDLVGNTCGLIRGWFVAVFAAASTFSFPGMQLWLGAHMRETVRVLWLNVARRVMICVTRGSEG